MMKVIVYDLSPEDAGFAGEAAVGLVDVDGEWRAGFKGEEALVE